jgi:STE24 endopeptidase
VNESKASRYHRLSRGARVASLAVGTALLGVMLWIRPSLEAWLYGLLLVVAYEILTLPLGLYLYRLEQRYELSSQSLRSWLADQAKALAISAVAAAGISAAVYRLIESNADLWWLMAGMMCAGLLALLAGLAPVLLLPLFFKLTPLDRPELTARLLDLSQRAGVPVMGVYELGLGAKTKRANAALAGAGPSRRILLSDTMLADYTDDEIEVVLAHELGHHAHGDIARSLALESVLLLVAAGVAAVVLNAAWQPLGLRTAADPAGLPLLALAAGAVMLLSTPLVNAFSRANERRADAFALALTRRPAAFVSAMRRLGQQNLEEESPSRLVVGLFRTHPPIEERIRGAAISADLT